MFDNINPGSEIKITVTKTPSREADVDTLRRILLLSPQMQHEHRKAKAFRAKRTVGGIRAGRMWYKRVPKSILIAGKKGDSSTIRFRPQIINDMKAISKYISVEPVA